MKEISGGFNIAKVFGANVKVVNDEIITGELTICKPRFFFRANKFLVAHLDENNNVNTKVVKT